MQYRRETILYDRLGGGAVRCAVCLRRCRIPEGGRGFCLTRENRGGTLYSLVYGAVAALHVAPIEMKPVYHYLPGSEALSLGTIGCNFLCPGCQNWELSFAMEEKGGRRQENDRGTKDGNRAGAPRFGSNPSTSAASRPGPDTHHSDASRPAPPIPPGLSYLSPEDSVREAARLGCRGISWTYNEPTMWLEYTIDAARCARERNPGNGEKDRLYTNCVTNGAMTPEALDALGPYLDVFRVDVKGFSRRTYDRIARFPHWEGVLANVKSATHRWSMHVELVTNVIPGVNDDAGELRGLVRWIRDETGPDTPWHVTRFFPRWRHDARPTSVKDLFEIREMARGEGLRYVYVGNIPENPPESERRRGSPRGAADTFCPGCGKTLVERHPDSVRVLLEKNRCPECSHPVPGRFDQGSG